MKAVYQGRSGLWTSMQPPWFPCRFSIRGSSCGPTWRTQTCNFTRTKCTNGIFQELRRKAIYFSSILSLLNAQFLAENMIRTHGHPPHAGLTARRAERCQSRILPSLCSTPFCGVLLKTVNSPPTHTPHPPYFASQLPSHSFLWSKCASRYGAKAVALGERRLWLSNLEPGGQGWPCQTPSPNVCFICYQCERKGKDQSWWETS